jgi:predicted RNA binding protein YcfA (HicA-like mRNA interferase family)
MTAKFPVDAPRAKVIATLQALGFRSVRRGNHIAMVRDSADGTRTPLTLPAHPTIKSSTLRTICTQARIPREEFPTAFRRLK